MIQVESARIQEFRGIRDLTLSFGGKSFVIWGPNGSGKSGVVDAIDFALTGDIGRLRGEGSGGLTVLRHGPHVHKRDDPSAARVTLTIRDPATGASAVLTRTVKTAKSYTLSPDTPSLRAAVERAAQHPEVTLSRREIIKYIVAKPGDRAKEVQALLKLDHLGDIRSLLRTVQSKTTAGVNAAETELKAAEQAMSRHLDLPGLVVNEVLSAINKRRSILGVESLSSVDPDTNLVTGLGSHDAVEAFNKASAMRDVQALIDAVTDSEAVARAAHDMLVEIEALEADPELLSALTTRSFLEAGLDFVVESSCPFCDAPWPDVEALRAHLSEKLQRSDRARDIRSRLQAAASSLLAEVRKVRELARATVPHSGIGPSGLAAHLQQWCDELAALESCFATLAGSLEEKSRLADPLAVPDSVAEGAVALLAEIRDRPDQSAEIEARTFLTVANERWARRRVAAATCAEAAALQTSAGAIYETYCTVADEALADLYRVVQDDFGEYYREINSEDESAFRAELEPDAGKLDLSVDFYGIGMFPPGAYHSEGHQDGMGVCLYLALMKQILGDEFRFAVLDDVVMSVDRDHRRQFCKLLKDRFPDVQFVITTHDDMWARQLQSSGLVSKNAQAHFHGWSVDDGPVHEAGTDFWDRIEEDLAQGDVPAAAHRLRRNLESILSDLAQSLRAQVPYRPDGNHDLGELLSAVKGKHGKLLKQAASSANSWNLQARKDDVDQLKVDRSAAVLAQESEQWAVNAAVHFNDWANFTKSDFRPVVDAWKQFLSLFQCANQDCGSWVYVAGPPTKEESLRCSCGTFDVNLLTK